MPTPGKDFRELSPQLLLEFIVSFSKDFNCSSGLKPRTLKALREIIDCNMEFLNLPDPCEEFPLPQDNPTNSFEETLQVFTMIGGVTLTSVEPQTSSEEIIMRWFTVHLMTEPKLGDKVWIESCQKSYGNQPVKCVWDLAYLAHLIFTVGQMHCLEPLIQLEAQALKLSIEDSNDTELDRGWFNLCENVAGMDVLACLVLRNRLGLAYHLTEHICATMALRTQDPTLELPTRSTFFEALLLLLYFKDCEISDAFTALIWPVLPLESKKCVLEVLTKKLSNVIVEDMPIVTPASFSSSSCSIPFSRRPIISRERGVYKGTRQKPKYHPYKGPSIVLKNRAPIADFPYLTPQWERDGLELAESPVSPLSLSDLCPLTAVTPLQRSCNLSDSGIMI